MKKILVIKAHTRKHSFCNALADKYIEGAKDSGHEIETLCLIDLNLEHYLKYEHREIAKLPDDLQNTQKNILWADHIIFVYPTWWGSSPALLKVFFEVVFVTGFAYKFRNSKSFIPKWDKFLTGKTASIISTMDTPPFLMYLLIKDPGGKLIRYIMDFTGVKLIKKHYFGVIISSTEQQRKKWLDRAYKIGKNE